MKRLMALAAVLALVLSTAAFAQDFGKFSMNVADGWTATEEAPTVIVTKNDKTSSFSVTIMPAEGNTAETFANAFVEEFKKSFATVGTPEKDAEGGYSWDMTAADGVQSKAMLAVENGSCKLVVMTNLEAGAEDIGNMLESIVEK